MVACLTMGIIGISGIMITYGAWEIVTLPTQNKGRKIYNIFAKKAHERIAGYLSETEKEETPSKTDSYFEFKKELNEIFSKGINKLEEIKIKRKILGRSVNHIIRTLEHHKSEVEKEDFERLKRHIKVDFESYNSLFAIPYKEIE